MRLRAILIPVILMLIGGCASTPPPSPDRDHYRQLSSEEVSNWIIYCLREDCQGRAEAWSTYRGPRFNPGQRLTVLKWQQKKAGKSVVAFRVRIKDDGIIYDTTVNIDALAYLGPNGIKRIEIKDIYGGDWGFNEVFTEAAASVAILGGLAAKGASKLHEATADAAQSVGTLYLITGSLCGEGDIKIRSLSFSSTYDLDCCGWGNLGSTSYSLPQGDYELSYNIKTCPGNLYSGKGVRFSVRGRSATTLRLNLGSGSYTVE